MREKPKIKKTFKNSYFSFFIEIILVATFVFISATTLSYKLINSDTATVPYMKINGESYNINKNSCLLTSDCYNIEVKKGDTILFEKLPYSINNSGNFNEYAFSDDIWSYTVSEKDTEFRLSAEKLLYNFKVVSNE
jgi:hypothetical protein